MCYLAGQNVRQDLDWYLHSRTNSTAFLWKGGYLYWPCGRSGLLMGMVIYTRLVVDLAMEYATRLGKRTVTQLWHSSGFTSSSVAGLKSQSLNLVLLSSVEQRQQVLMSWITILMQKYYRNGWIENRTPMRTSKSRQTLSQAGNTGQARNIYLIWRKPMWPSGNMISKSCSGFPSLSDCLFSCRNVPGTAESESRFTQDSHNISRKILWVFHEFFYFFSRLCEIPASQNRQPPSLTIFSQRKVFQLVMFWLLRIDYIVRNDVIDHHYSHHFWQCRVTVVKKSWKH